ncbi:MAG TPA: glycosyltransferase family 2 protein [Kiritimatiellia bacterium]|nr:glycosyltransferase family 2 protein [Kiritimatiellia bacterium]
MSGEVNPPSDRGDARRLSVVIPVYNERAALDELRQRLVTTLNGLDLDAEVIFVDDGSHDGSAERLDQFAEDDSRFRVIHLSRNFGHQPALSAGIDHASGDAVVLMDGDLQDRPEAIPEFIAEWRKGNEVVYAVRSSRRESLPMRAAFKLFYKVIQKMSGIRQPLDAGIFCLLDRRVVTVLKSMPERNRYFPGLRAYAGFVQAGVKVQRDARFADTSRVRVLGLIKLAMDGIISFSFVPIRLITLSGVMVAFFSFAYIIRVLHKKWVTGEAILGWASTLTAILMLGGIQLITLGVLGEYIGRIYEEVKKRPFYVIGRTKNLERD